MSDLNREQFEEWFNESGLYKFKETALAAWEASRERLVIELPEKATVSLPSDMFSIGNNGAINKCRDAIRATGVKTK